MNPSRLETKPDTRALVLTLIAPWVKSVEISVALSFVSIVGVAWVVGKTLDLGEAFPLLVMSIFGAGAVIVVALADRSRPERGFGSANSVTLARGALTALVLALIGQDATVAVCWFAAATVLLVVLLDGVDGWLARRLNEASAFGARFDMETDALLILGSAVLAWRFGKAGPWILAAGLTRYAFVGAGYVLPWMRRSLPSSRRRQTICVLQSISLIVCLAPVVARPFSDLVALAGLLLLFASFAVDVRWLADAATRDTPAFAPH